MAETIQKTTQSGTLYGFASETLYAPDKKRPTKRLVQFFPGQGCGIWLERKSDCCVFCRLPAGTRLAVMGPGHEDHFGGWEVAADDYQTMIDISLADCDDIDSIVCFNGGSFFSDREVPAAARQHLYQVFSNHPTARELMVESRPELVTDTMLGEVERYIGDKTLKVAIGLESMNDRVRNQILKKFIGRKSFLRALDLLHKRGHKTFVYVFLGAPGLSERDAYLDARSSIAALADLGVDEIALSCAFVPPGGILEALYKARAFRPPWLWTIKRLIEDATQNGWPLSVGGFDDFPPPIAVSQNCGKCDAAIMAEIDGYRRTGAVSGTSSCGCQAHWSTLLMDSKSRCA